MSHRADFRQALRFDASRLIGYVIFGWDFFLAYFHLSDAAVCRMSMGRSVSRDFHTERDSDDPAYFVETVRCRRCGKDFWIP